MADIDLAAPQVVHIVAIGGGAMSALATVFLRMGHRVSGSDLRGSAALERLRLLGAQIHVGHDAANVPDDATMLVASTAITPDNPEVVRGHALGRGDVERAGGEAPQRVRVRVGRVNGRHEWISGPEGDAPLPRESARAAPA